MSTLTLNGSKLPALFYLSDYLNNEAEAVRLTGLKAGQTAVVDASLDGGYTNPDTPKVANWKSAVTGREGGAHGDAGHHQGDRLHGAL